MATALCMGLVLLGIWQGNDAGCGQRGGIVRKGRRVGAAVRGRCWGRRVPPRGDSQRKVDRARGYSAKGWEVFLPCVGGFPDGMWEVFLPCQRSVLAIARVFPVLRDGAEVGTSAAMTGFDGATVGSR